MINKFEEKFFKKNFSHMNSHPRIPTPPPANTQATSEGSSIDLNNIDFKAILNLVQGNKVRVENVASI